MTNPSMVQTGRFSDRDLITSVINTFYILDYGFVSTVNDDGTVDVTHAKRLKTRYGDSLDPTKTKSVELLTLSGKGFSINWDIKQGDQVLLLGLKDYIPSVEDVTSATETTVYLHYTRETLKAFPLSVFNDEAKVTVSIEDGSIEMGAEGDLTADIQGDSSVTIEGDATDEVDGDYSKTTKGDSSEEVDGDIKIESKGKMTIKTSSGLTLNGNVKVTGGQFECGGTVSPTGSGALCGIPYCPFTGAPQCGSTSSGT